MIALPYPPDREEWCPIPGLDWYEASSQGRVRSWKKKGRYGGMRTVPAVLSPKRKRQTGHLSVNLYLTPQQGRMWSVHRLVALAFFGEPPDGKFDIRHLDGNPAKNDVNNLAYGTPAENSADMVRHGTRLHGEAITVSRYTAEQVRRVVEMTRAGVPCVEIAATVDMDAKYISRIRCAEIWTGTTGLTESISPRKRKLNEEKVREIVQLIDAGWRNRQIADRFGVARDYIGAIRNGGAWRHVTGFQPA